MGMYTQLHFASELKKDAPKEVIEILKYMAGSNLELEELKNLPDHAFFECSRWDILFKCDSYYFDYNTHCDFFFDGITDSWHLSVTSNLKNYSHEIDKFIDWITPYLNKRDGEFLGYSRYEETEYPELIFYKNN